MDNPQSLCHQYDLFIYTGDELLCEDLTKYTRYGLHPVILGDVLPKPSICVSDQYKKPRYRVMFKIGFGAFCTVWLARDLLEGRYVAVKICLESDSPDAGRESQILSQLREIGPGHRGHERVIQLFDAFVISGPNGFHECLVTELVASFRDLNVRDYCSSAAIRQTVEGFAFLHEQGIVHGDPHIGNFGIAIPQLEQYDEEDIIDYFEDPEIIPVIPRDPAFSMHSLPPYLTSSVSIANFLQAMKAFPASPASSIKIIDFGRAYRVSGKHPLLPGAAPTVFRPPEITIRDICKSDDGYVWNRAADVWALGCTLYHLLLGEDLFSVWGSSKDFLFRTLKLGGPPPEAWLENWKDCFNQSQGSFGNRDKAWDSREVKAPYVKLANEDDRGVFFDLIKKMVMTNPEGRCVMNELLTHPFIDKDEIAAGAKSHRS